MALFNNRLRLRSGIVINLVALGFIILSFTDKNYSRGKLWLIITAIFALLVLIYTYYYSFSQTGLWRETHTIIPGKSQLTTGERARALSFAYSVFTIILIVFLLYQVLSKTIPHIAAVAGLIYLAHILPAVYLGWKR